MTDTATGSVTEKITAFIVERGFGGVTRWVLKGCGVCGRRVVFNVTVSVCYCSKRSVEGRCKRGINGVGAFKGVVWQGDFKGRVLKGW